MVVEASRGRVFDEIETVGNAQGGGLVAFLRRIGLDLARALMWVVHTIISALALGFMGVTELLYRWVTGPEFIGFSFTGPDNPFVYQNWLDMRNLANIGIILGLVYVGLRTALDLGSFNTKKTLVRLLVLAVLINFTPVLIGLMIDAAHIVMNHFLGHGRDMKLTENLRTAMFFVVDYELYPLISLIQLLVLTIGAVFVGFLFLILAATFIVRYLILWVLVVLSPLAFLAFAFPGAKKFWQMWWSAFISWTFVGVPIAFFVFLGDSMNNQCLIGGVFHNTSAHLSEALRYGPDAFPPGTFCAIMPVVLLYIGYKISLGLAPSFTKTVITGVGAGTAAAAAWGYRQVKQRTSQAYDFGKQKAREGEMLLAARRLNINTAGWQDRRRGHAVRTQVADEIMKSPLATPGEKARAARWMSTDQKIIEQKEEKSRYGRKLKKADVNELKAEIFSPSSLFMVKGGPAVAPAKKRAMAIHALIKKDPEEARRILPTIQFENATEAQRVYTALYNIGHKKEAALFAMSQAGRYGSAIQHIDSGWAREMGEDQPEQYLLTAFSKAKTGDAGMVAAAYKNAIDPGKNKDLAKNRNDLTIINGLIRSDRNVVRDVVRELKGSDQQKFIKTLLEAAQENEEAARPIIHALESWGYLPREKKGERKDGYFIKEGREGQSWS